MCRFCARFADFSYYNASYQYKDSRKHMQEFHGHNAKNPKGRFFMIRTHKRTGKNIKSERYYFMDPALDMIQEAATLRNTLLVTHEELERGYLTNIFIE